ncbi:MAG: AMIN domain-containing protein [Gemmatimonadota bacterium]|nr:MAG: AMIN domain-containing protein [Gemmatimonadota bacterium]
MIFQQLLATILAAVSLSADSTPGSEAVTEIKIAAVGRETEIVVIAEGEIEVSDFLLDEPTRLILDLRGARHALPRYAYEEIGRGGVIRLRSSQFLEDVVRLVIDLTFAPTYSVDANRGTVTVRFDNPGPPFEPWSTSLDGVESQMALSAPDGARLASGDPDVVRIGSGPSLPSVSAGAQQPRITVTYDSASVLDVIAGFAEFADISIVPNASVAGQSVRGVEIRDRPWDEALDAILAAQGLGWRVTRGGIIVVDRLDSLIARESLQSETRVIRINYANADTVAGTLQKLATPNLGQVVAYQGTNSVIVTDIPPVVDRMDSLVSVLDRRIPQVAIEAKIVFVDRTDVFELGIVYDLKQVADGTDFVTQGLNQAISAIDPTKPPQVQDLNGDGIITPDEQFFELTNNNIVNVSGDAVATLANANDRVAQPALSLLTTLAFGGYSLFAWIEALETNQLADVQAAPSVQVLDNHRAYIQVGERTPVRVLEEGAQVEDARINVFWEDTGIILEVTPHVTNNNQVLMELSAQRSGVEAAPSDVGFVIKRQIGETRLLVDDGETAVIGGLTLSEVSRSMSGIPGLMNLPLLGALFRTTREREVKVDLIILVTPHIMEPR